MAKYVMALDAGTTSCRCILFDAKSRICSVAQKEFKQYFPKAGWVEHNANEIWSTQISVAVEAMAKVGATAADIASIGITNQRETTVVWDRETEQPIYNAIVWQCRRTAKYCDSLKAAGKTEFFRKRTGLVLDAYFSATKLKWILDNVEGVREAAVRGELCMGTVDSWLVFRLTGGKVHATDYTNASRTMLFNIHTLDWDDDLLDMLTIPRSMMPEPRPSDAGYGETTVEGLFPEPIRIAGVLGDSHGALAGQMCFAEGLGKVTYGTGSSVMVNIGERPSDPPRRLSDVGGLCRPRQGVLRL